MKHCTRVAVMILGAVSTIHAAQHSPPRGVTVIELEPLREYLEYAEAPGDAEKARVGDLSIRFDPDSLTEAEARFFATYIVKSQRQNSALGRYEVFASPPGWKDRLVVVKSVRQSSERLFLLRRETGGKEAVLTHIVDHLPGFPTTTDLEFLRNEKGRIAAALIVRNQWGETQVGIVEEGTEGIAFDGVFEYSIVEQPSRRFIVAVTILEILGSAKCPPPDPSKTLESIITNCFRVSAAVGIYGSGGVTYGKSREILSRMNRGYSILDRHNETLEEFETAKKLLSE